VKEAYPGVYKEHDPAFLKRLEKSFYWLEIAQRYMRSFGFADVQISDTVYGRGAWRDLPLQDMTVNGVPLEVRGVNVWFKTPAQWPFKRVLLDEGHRFDKSKGRTSWAQMNISMETGCAIWVPLNGYQPKVEAVDDGLRDMRRDILVCPTPLIRPVGALVNALAEHLGIMVLEADENETDIMAAIGERKCL
jgi:hypothetical protein